MHPNKKILPFFYLFLLFGSICTIVSYTNTKNEEKTNVLISSDEITIIPLEGKKNQHIEIQIHADSPIGAYLVNQTQYDQFKNRTDIHFILFQNNYSFHFRYKVDGKCYLFCKSEKNSVQSSIIVITYKQNHWALLIFIIPIVYWIVMQKNTLKIESLPKSPSE